MMKPRSPRALFIAGAVATIVHGQVREGYVHSVFRRAANLYAPPTALLAITEPTTLRVPNGVVVDSLGGPPEGAFLGLGAAMPALIGDGLIRVPAVGLGIDLTGVPVWDCRPQFPDRPVAPALLGRHLDRLARLVRARARGKRWSFASVLEPLVQKRIDPGTSPRRTLTPLPPAPSAQGAGERREASLERLSHRARTAANDLLAGLSAGETDRVSDAAGRLAGLGQGLTPSGDDFLIGICGALALADAVLPSPSGCRQGGARFDHAKTIAAAAEGRTTMLSATWLDFAARGEFSAELGGVLVSLADAEATDLDRAVARLLAIGGLSGLDTAMGVLLGGRAALAWR